MPWRWPVPPPPVYAGGALSSYGENPATLLQAGIVDIPDGGGRILTFAAIPAFVYQVEASGDLTAWPALPIHSSQIKSYLAQSRKGAKFFRN